MKQKRDILINNFAKIYLFTYFFISAFACIYKGKKISFEKNVDFRYLSIKTVLKCPE